MPTVSDSLLHHRNPVELASGKWYQVKPHSPWPESFAVLVAAIVIISLMTLRFGLTPGDNNQQVLKSYQALMQSLPRQDQLVYRTLLAGVPDVVDMLDELGQWPEATLLEEAEVPPFAPGYLPPPLNQLIWVSYDGGTWVDYLGHDVSGQSNVSYILRLIDLHGGYHPHPHPGVDYDPNQTLAIQVWRFPQAQRPYPGERLPEAGWLWLIDENDRFLQVSTTTATGAVADG
jgi:hypothetical protein